MRGWIRRAKVTKIAPPRLHHIGASRPDLSIEAMIKIKIKPAETEVERFFYTAIDGTISKQRVGVYRTELQGHVCLVNFRKKSVMNSP